MRSEMHIHKNNLRTLVARSLIALSILAVSGYARSQELPKDDQKSRPKIGLVLEGGGAPLTTDQTDRLRLRSIHRRARARGASSGAAADHCGDDAEERW